MKKSKNNEHDMNKKTVIILGGTSEIGLAISEKLKENYKIIIIGRSKTVLNKELRLIPLDASLENSENILESIDNPFALINCIGGISNNPEEWKFLNHTKTIWDDIITKNLEIPFRFTRKFIELKKESFGKVVFFSSISAFNKTKFGPAYSSSKLAICNISNSINDNFKNIHSTVIIPGPIKTQKLLNNAPKEIIENALEIEYISNIIEFILKNDCRINEIKVGN